MRSFEEVKNLLENKRILVANRGIPARRIARSIYELGAVPVMTATDIDKTAPFTSGAVELLLLGEDPRAYLNIDLIIAKAKAKNIVAIHPGWGFASENEEFPAKCAEAGIVFIGPDAAKMRLLGNKVEVRRIAQKLNIPVVPGSEDAVSIEEAKAFAREIGYPIMLKAEGGGGGRGIYIVEKEEELESAFVKASTQAQAAFANPRLYVEKYLPWVRHIEIQVVADKYGNVLCLDERDCTIQRNHQKLIEITPSPWKKFSPELRAQLKDYSQKLISSVDYYSLATVEFLIDKDGNPYLIEVNTRLQVEHGITECRYGIDLVEEQIAIAFGSQLRWKEEELLPSNWAMQVRVNLEDPQDNFTPNSGTITRYQAPGSQGIRLDSCITTGYHFPSQYDSAGSLLVAYGKSWQKILRVMNRALREYTIGGVKTTIPFYRKLINHPSFQAADFDTNFIATHPEVMVYRDREEEAFRLSQLIAELSAKGFNPYIQLGEYRSREDKRIGRFQPVLPEIGLEEVKPIYPRGDRDAILDFIRDSDYVHFTDTTPRDITQSNSGNRFRLAEDKLIAPYLDNCQFFSIENGGGAHYHVALLANMTYPFSEAKVWNELAPKTLKQILVRSTNLLGYKPQPRNLMQLTGEMICEHYDVVRCFDFLNHIENMRPLAEVVLSSESNIFEPAISLSYAKGFDIPHYLGVVEEILHLVKDVVGTSLAKAQRLIILGLKDMAGVCPPQFIAQLVTQIKKQYPELIIHYHRHYTDGLFVPAVVAAAKAGAKIVDTALGAAVRWYGQGEVLSTAAYMEEQGLKTNLNRDMIRKGNFVLKQIMPYYDRYVSPYFQGIDYDVVEHAMPGGATSSSQEGAMKQGYIHLLPYMLKFLAGIRQIVRYHDVTPGSQITWNTAFLAITGAYKRGGEQEVKRLLHVLEKVITTPEDKLDAETKRDRLLIYKDCNDAFRDLLLGKFGRLPLGFPPDWVYKSAFGDRYKQALAMRTEKSPLEDLEDVNIREEKETLDKLIGREADAEELVNYLNHPGDTLKTIKFKQQFGDPNNIPLDVWFEGLEVGQTVHFRDSNDKPHSMQILDISTPDAEGNSIVRYSLDSEFLTYQVKVSEARYGQKEDVEMADPSNPYHVAAPCNGDLWIVYVKPNDVVKKGEELFNISVMKQEKAILSPIDGMVKRVIKTANYEQDKKMVPVKEGELIIELMPLSKICPTCQRVAPTEDAKFCLYCGQKLS